MIPTADRDLRLLGDVAISADAAMRYCAGVGYEAFVEDEMRRDAVVTRLTTIGEAIKGLSPEAKALAPGIAWREAARMRDRLVHRYHHVDDGVVWRVVKEELPPLRTAMDEIARALGRGPLPRTLRRPDPAP